MSYQEKILSILKEHYDFDSLPIAWDTASQIAVGIGIKKPTVKDARVISSCFEQIYGAKKGYFRVSNGKRLIFIPPRREK